MIKKKDYTRVLCYAIDKDVLYISFHMNWIAYYLYDKIHTYNINDPIYNLFEHLDLPEGVIANCVANIIGEMQYKYYIIDMNHIASEKAWQFVVLSPFIKGEQNIIFMNIDSEVYDQIKGECELEDYELIKNINHHNIYSSQGGNSYIDNLLSKQSIHNYLCMYLFNQMKSFEYGINKYEYLPSSNVYANRYIDVKKIFVNPDLLFLSAYILCEISQDVFNHCDYILCSSNNGAILSTIIGSILNKPVQYLQNLGPNLSVNDENLIDRIENEKLYLYVFDFICLGSEIKHTIMLTRLKHSTIIGALGYSIYKEPFREDNGYNDLNIKVLFSINSYEKYYECYFDKGVSI